MPRKRTFETGLGQIDHDENFDQSDPRKRRQRTVSTSSVETVRAPPSKPLSDKANRRPTISSSHKPGRSFDSAKAITTASSSSSLRHLGPQHAGVPAGSSIKVNSRRNTLGGSATTTKLEPLPPPVAVPVLSGPSTLAQLFFSDEVVDVENLDMNSLPSIPSPPSSPRRANLKTHNRSSGHVKRSSSKDVIATLKAQVAPSQARGVAAQVSTLRGAKRPPRSQPPPPPVSEVEELALEGNGGHLRSTDCQLYVSFSGPPHYETWDLPDEAIILCPASLHIMLRDPRRWENSALAQPDTPLIDIECRTVPAAADSRFTEQDHDKWDVRFSGAEVPSSGGKTAPPDVALDGIAIENSWVRVYSMPVHGKGCQENLAALVNSNHNNSMGRDDKPMSLSDNSDDADLFYSPTPTVPGRGWIMHFWIPVPTALFLKKETRVFEIAARVWVNPTRIRTAGPESPHVGIGGTVSAPTGAQEMIDLDADYIEAYTEMTVSHLRKAREMVPSGLAASNTTPLSRF